MAQAIGDFRHLQPVLSPRTERSSPGRRLNTLRSRPPPALRKRSCCQHATRMIPKLCTTDAILDVALNCGTAKVGKIEPLIDLNCSRPASTTERPGPSSKSIRAKSGTEYTINREKKGRVREHINDFTLKSTVTSTENLYQKMVTWLHYVHRLFWRPTTR